MDQRQATARAGQIARDTAAALCPRPGPDFSVSLPNEPGPCLADLPSAGQMVQVSRTALLTGVRPGRQVAVAGQVKAYWQKKGYVITATANFSKSMPAIFAYTPEHDPFEVFTVSLETSVQGAIALGATSPCIWPKGTPIASGRRGIAAVASTALVLATRVNGRAVSRWVLADGDVVSFGGAACTVGGQAAASPRASLPPGRAAAAAEGIAGRSARPADSTGEVGGLAARCWGGGGAGP